MQSASSSCLSDRSLIALAVVNFFLADARDGLGPFLDGFLATRGWSPMTLGFIATLGGVLGMIATPLFGAWVDESKRKRMLIIVPVILVTAAALWTLASPDNASVFGGQSATAIVGAIIGPALMGLTLGLVGERQFSQQVSRNEFWNHLGNVVSLAGIYVATMMFGLSGIIGLMVFTAVATVMAVLAIDPDKINHALSHPAIRPCGRLRDCAYGPADPWSNSGLVQFVCSYLSRPDIGRCRRGPDRDRNSHRGRANNVRNGPIQRWFGSCHDRSGNRCVI